MVTWQLTIDAHDAARMVAFWTQALGYVVTPPPEGFGTWNDWYRSVGVPDDELDLTGDGADRIMDPAGEGPPIWFQPVPERKTVKNRLHIDLFRGGGRGVPLAVRRERVDAEVARLVAAGASVLRLTSDDVPDAAGTGSYFAVMQDPEGNEFCVS